jgi:alkanesulfonate monooxygenase SsuD/methylene tetrahydromethanopterin reductase-like flavin-dependent oxidoreductase (luciferase family)
MKRDSAIGLSVLDLTAVREGSTVAESFGNTVKLAQAAEAWGYVRQFVRISWGTNLSSTVF